MREKQKVKNLVSMLVILLKNQISGNWEETVHMMMGANCWGDRHIRVRKPEHQANKAVCIKEASLVSSTKYNRTGPRVHD